MKIKEMNIGGFGVWKDLSLIDFSDQMTVFYGRNEAGKTTLMQFLRTVLYGCPEERCTRYLPPLYGGLPGGSLQVENEKSLIRVQRSVNPDQGDGVAGDLKLTEPGGESHGAAHLEFLLGGVDELTFNNVFAIGLREIQELGSLGNTDAAEYLYKLTSGFDRVSLVDVIRKVEENREVLWSSDPDQHSVVLNLLLKQKRLAREIDDLSGKGWRWTKLASQSSDIELELQEISQQLGEDERAARVVEMAIQIRDRWNARQLIDEQIASYGVLPDEKDLSLDNLAEINQRISTQKSRISKIVKQRREIASKAKSLPVNRRLWAQASRIEALQEHSPWISSLQRQIGETQCAISELGQQAARQLEEIGQQLKKENTNEIPELSPQMLESLRVPARQLKETKSRLAAVEKDCQEGRHELAEAENELEAELERRGCQNLGDSINVSGRMVSRLKKRVRLEEKLGKLLKDRKRLESDLDAVVREQLLPTEKLVLIGVLCVLGVFLAVGGIFLKPEFLGTYPEALGIFLGSVSLAIAYMIKSQYNQIAKEALDDCQSQLELLKTHIRRAKDEREEIDRELPNDVTHPASRLEDAEHELARLEGILPLENRAKTAKLEIEQSRKELAEVEEELLEQKRKWRLKLRSMELPENLVPLQAKQLLDRTKRFAGFNLKIQELEAKLVQMQQDLGSLEDRVRKLMLEVELEPESEDPVKRLVQLGDALVFQRSLFEQRNALARDYRGLRKQLEKRHRVSEKFRKSRQQMFTKVDAKNEDAYRDFILKHEQVRSLAGKRESISGQIDAAIGNNFSEVEVIEELETDGGTSLESRWENFQQQLEGLGERQSSLNQQLGEHQQEMRSLAGDRRLDEARLELENVKFEIEQTIREWQVTATTSCLLESVRNVYEKERQPETLKEASEFLCQISGGKYTRIWTRLTENILLVDNADGESLPLEVLSRGTRECVYLGLRMALVTAYARRGAILPLVLDDVLVNFDAARAREAARAIKTFSDKGFQVILFTCHNHIRDLFMDLDCDVRELPHHAEVLNQDHPVIGPRFLLAEETQNEEQRPAEPASAEQGTVIHVPAISGGVNYEMLNRRSGYEFSCMGAIRQGEAMPISWPGHQYEVVDQADENLEESQAEHTVSDEEAA